MSTEANKAIVQRITDAMNARDWEALRAVTTDEFVTYMQTHPLLTAFPDLQTTNEVILAEGDFVATHWTNRGTHLGEYRGVLPTGNQVSYTGTSIDRIVDGKVVESWHNSDQLGLLGQLGVVTD